jgi:hypothetical protein
MHLLILNLYSCFVSACSSVSQLVCKTMVWLRDVKAVPVQGCTVQLDGSPDVWLEMTVGRITIHYAIVSLRVLQNPLHCEAINSSGHASETSAVKKESRVHLTIGRVVCMCISTRTSHIRDFVLHFALSQLHEETIHRATTGYAFRAEKHITEITKTFPLRLCALFGHLRFFMLQ